MAIRGPRLEFSVGALLLLALASLLVLAMASTNQRWGFGKVAVAVALAIVPFATIPFERSLVKSSALEGSWRTTQSEDPRDQGFIDRLFRWFIARPIVLLAVLLIAIPAVFAFLLFLGKRGHF